MSWESLAESVEAAFKVLAQPVAAAGKMAAVPFLQVLKWLFAFTGDTEVVHDLDTLKTEMLSSSEATIAENRAKVAEATARANAAADEEHHRRLREAQADKSEAEAREAHHRADKAAAEAYAAVIAADVQQTEAEIKLAIARADADAKLITARSEAYVRFTDAVSKLKGEGGSLSLCKRDLARLIGTMTEQLRATPPRAALPGGAAGDLSAPSPDAGPPPVQ